LNSQLEDLPLPVDNKTTVEKNQFKIIFTFCMFYFAKIPLSKNIYSCSILKITFFVIILPAFIKKGKHVWRIK
jgi:hypothetical protein